MPANIVHVTWTILNGVRSRLGVIFFTLRGRPDALMHQRPVFRKKSGQNVVWRFNDPPISYYQLFDAHLLSRCSSNSENAICLKISRQMLKNRQKMAYPNFEADRGKNKALEYMLFFMNIHSRLLSINF